jgi:hypothetical protein
MFVFGEVNNCDGMTNVKQILVFPSKRVEKSFNAYKKINPVGDDNNHGAIYKLRAVLLINSKWRPIIRCGFDGAMLYDGTVELPTWQQALYFSKRELHSLINESFSKFTIERSPDGQKMVNATI